MVPQDQIIAYLLGELPPDKSRKMADFLQQNPQSLEEAKFYRHSMFAISHQKQLLEFQSLLQHSAASFPAHSSTSSFISPPKFPRRFYYLGLAAAVSLLLVFGSLHFLQPKTPASLFDAYYEKAGIGVLPALPQNELVSGGGEVQKKYEWALQCYQAGRYDAALEVLEAVSIYFPEESLFLKGLCLLESQNYVTAALSLQACTLPQAQWYYALSCLKMGEKAEAMRTLQLLEQENSFYQAQAAALLRDLR